MHLSDAMYRFVGGGVGFRSISVVFLRKRKQNEAKWVQTGVTMTTTYKEWKA